MKKRTRWEKNEIADYTIEKELNFRFFFFIIGKPYG